MASLSPQFNLIIDFPPKTSKSAVVCARMNNQSPPLSLCACLLNMFIDIFRPRERKHHLSGLPKRIIFFGVCVCVWGGGIGEKKPKKRPLSTVSLVLGSRICLVSQSVLTRLKKCRITIRLPSFCCSGSMTIFRAQISVRKKLSTAICEVEIRLPLLL